MITMPRTGKKGRKSVKTAMTLRVRPYKKFREFVTSHETILLSKRAVQHGANYFVSFRGIWFKTQLKLNCLSCRKESENWQQYLLSSYKTTIFYLEF
jgi:hypothetical protein